MSTVVVQYDFNGAGNTLSPTHSPRTTAAERTKFEGSSGPENNGVMSDHTAISANTATPKLMRRQFTIQD